MAVCIFLFLLSLTIISPAIAQPKSYNISIGSSLTPISNQSSWLSPSGQFAFGFYQQDDGFIIAIWFARIPEKTVVWTANQDNPKVEGNVTLLLTAEGGLTIQLAPGQKKQISETSESTSYASMLDTGNFVLYNSSSDIIWQTFDFPTNTILQEQRLKAGQTLFSSVSGTDNSKGMFRLWMQPDGNLVQYPIQSPADSAEYAYWSSKTDRIRAPFVGDSITLNLKDDGHLYIRTGLNIKNLSKSDISAPNGSVFYRMTIDVDGIFRLYSHSLNKEGNWSIKWESSLKKCEPMGLCGLNGYCTQMDLEYVCNCLPGFDFIDRSQRTRGCRRVVSLENCQSKYTMSTLENTQWANESYNTLGLTTEEACKDACLKDCNCEVVTFQDQYCSKQKLPLRYGRRVLETENSATAFIKVNNIDINGTANSKITKDRCKTQLHLGILIASASFVTCAFMFLAVSSVLIYRHRNFVKYRTLEQGNIGLHGEISLRSFTYAELEKATDGFKETLGRGSFGTVFKGVLPEGQRLVAVKRLENVVDEGEREFQAEMRTIGRTHHKNLVKLLGYCQEESNRLLVYEYMCNGSLAKFLFQSNENPGWNERVQTSLDIARGILYLHEECETQIIHCDIKPQNILMDEYQHAKLADFGLAKLLKRDQTKTFTKIRGTRGYVAPEWHKNMPVTVKADVYSFGIVLLEIICCRRSLDMELPQDEVILVEWVFLCFDTGELDKLVSDEEVDMKRFERIVRVALWCIQDEPSMRPSMKKVVLMLEGTIDIPIPPSPSSFLSSI